MVNKADFTNVSEYLDVVYSEKQLIKYKIIDELFKAYDLSKAVQLRPSPRIIESFGATLLTIYIMIRSKKLFERDKIPVLESIIKSGKPMPTDKKVLLELLVLIQELLDKYELTSITSKELNPNVAYKY